MADALLPRVSGPLLPPEFSDLERWVADWCLDSEPERYAKRLSSTMAEIQAFYDAVFPRAEAAMQYLEKLPIDALPEDAHRLLKLLYSLILMSFAVEIWKQPCIPDTGKAQFELEIEPAP